jgi:hypothetical protein
MFPNSKIAHVSAEKTKSSGAIKLTNLKDSSEIIKIAE